MEPRPAHLVPSYAPMPTSTPSRKALRPKEIAELYGIGPSTIYNAIYAGRLQSHRIGRAHTVPVEEVARWLAAGGAGREV